MIRPVEVADVAYIMSTRAVRDRANRMLELARSGGTHFAVDTDKLGPAADLVVQVIKRQYPTLDVPYHSRWRHFVGDQGALLGRLKERLAEIPKAEAGRAMLDLIIVSVLLDAGAGDGWSFRAPSGEWVTRSEGLALASLQMFLEGRFSSDGSLCVDGLRLSMLEDAAIEAGFQVTRGNPLLGVSGRTSLLRKLGAAMASRPTLFPTGRPGDLMDVLGAPCGEPVEAMSVFDTVVQAFGDIWPARTTLAGANLGDTWRYGPFGEGPDGLVPLHKLSQWLSYSIIETLELNGVQVRGLEQLTGLAEYRNGGLFVDTGVLTLRDPAAGELAHAPKDPLIVEWRALTVALLDRMADEVRARLGVTDLEFPLPRVLEGGTWSAGRQLAAGLRPGGGSPILIASDGTVF